MAKVKKGSGINKKVIVIGLVAVVCFVGLIIGGAGIYYLATRTQTTNTGDGTVTETNNIVIENINYTDKNGMQYDIVKNKVTKQAEITMQYPVPDNIEYGEFLGKKTTLMPFAFNLTCGMFNAAFFDQAKFQETVDGLNSAGGDSSKPAIADDQEFKDKLEGYTVVFFAINFYDKEDNAKIARCASRDKDIKKAQVEVFRDYTGVPSFLDVKLGDFEED
jgi:hypothetical protein